MLVNSIEVSVSFNVDVQLVKFFIWSDKVWYVVFIWVLIVSSVVFKDVFTNDSCELKHTRISLYDLQKENFGFGFYYNGINPDSTSYPLVNELIYYKDKKYRDPWYMDNVGSFLIVIERKTNK